MDSLRAIAALAIVAYHVAPHAGAFRSEFTTAVSAQLSTGVALFFLISGTLLYRPFVLAHATGERPPDVRAYAWRRFLRIVPAYWAALHCHRHLHRPGGVRAAAAVLRLRPGLLARGGLPRHPGRVDALHRGLLLRVPADLRAGAAGRGKRTRASVWRVEATARLAACSCSGWPGAGSRSPPTAGGCSTSVNTLPAYLAWFAIGMGLAVTSAWLSEGGAKPAFVRFVERAPGVCWAVAGAALAATPGSSGRRYLGVDHSDLELLGHPRRPRGSARSG